MKKSIKDALLIVLLTAIFIGCYYIGEYTIKMVNKNKFISSAKELYKNALNNKNNDNGYFDSKSNKLEGTNLNYHIEYDSSGKITYFLVYNDKNAIEIIDDDILIDEIKIDDNNYVDLNNDKDSSLNVEYKHSLLNDKYKDGTSDFNNLVDEDELPIMTDEPKKQDSNENKEVKETPKDNDKEEVKPSEETKPSEENVPSKEETQSENTNSNTPSKPTYFEALTYELTKSSNCSIKTKGYSEVIKDNKYYYTVSLGYAPNACYSIEITKVTIASGENVTLHVKSVTPTIGMNCPQIVSYPCATAIFSRKPNNVAVIEEIDGKENPIIDKDMEEEIDNLTLKETNLGTLTYEISKIRRCSDITTPGYTVKKDNNKTVVSIGRGKVNYGGYQVNFSEINIDKNNNVILKAKSNNPPKNGVYTQAIDYPCGVIVFDKEPKSIKVYLNDNMINAANME